MYDSRALRAFVGIEQVAKAHHRGLIRHRLAPQVEQNKLGEKIFEAVGRVLQARGLRLSKGTIVDATIIAAPVRRRTSPTRRSRPAIAPTSGPWQRNRGNPAAFLPMPEACAMASGPSASGSPGHSSVYFWPLMKRRSCPVKRAYSPLRTLSAHRPGGA